MSNQELKQIVEEFNQFVFSIDDSIKELKEIADSLQVDAVFDFSETSLGRIQVLVDKFKGGEVGDPDEKWNIINLVAKYLGEVFRKEVIDERGPGAISADSDEE